MRSSTLSIFLLLFSTLALGGPSDVPSKCSFSVPHYCSCNENGDGAVRLVALRMCYYPDDPRDTCHPCPLSYQDQLNCTYQESEYPICSFKKFGPEESREIRHSWTANYTGKRSKFIKFTFGRHVLIHKSPPNQTYDATLNKNHPKSYKSDASLVVNSNENVNYSTLATESKTGNSGLKEISGNNHIPSYMRAGKEFGDPEQDIVSKISMDGEGRNPDVNLQLVDIDTMRFLTRESIRNIPKFIRPAFHNFLTDGDKTNKSKHAKEQLKISLTFRDLEKSDNIQKLRKLSADKTYPLYFVAIKQEIKTEENDPNATELEKDNQKKKLIILEIKKGKPTFDSKVNRNQEKYIQGENNHKNVATESSKSSENSLAESTIIGAENDGEFKIDNGFLSRNPEDISKIVSNDNGSNIKKIKAEKAIGAGISLSFKEHLIPRGKEGKLQEKDFQGRMVLWKSQAMKNASRSSASSFQAEVAAKASFLAFRRKKVLLEEKYTKANINVGGFKDDEKFSRGSSAMNNEKDLSPEVLVDINSRPLKSDVDASRISEKTSHEDAVVIGYRTDSNALRSSEKPLLEDVGDLISRALQSALRNSEISLHEDAGDIRSRTLEEQLDSRQPDVDASKDSQKSSSEKVVHVSPETFQPDADVSRNYEKSLVQNFQENIDSKSSSGKRVFILVNKNAPAGPELDSVVKNNSSKFQEETVESKGTANSVSRKYLVENVGSERNSGTFYEDADDKRNSGIFPDVSNNSEKGNNAFVNNSKTITGITNELTADIWEHYKDINEQKKNILKNENLIRRKRSFNTTKSKVIARFMINDTDVTSRRKRRDPLAENTWCCIKLMTRNGNLDCTVWTYKKECTLCCHTGYAYEGTKKTIFTCDRKANTWTPSMSQGCAMSGEAPPPNPGSPEKPKAQQNLLEAYADYYEDVDGNRIDQGLPPFYEDYPGQPDEGPDDYGEGYDYYGDKRRKRSN